jgi:hypothetical protein
MAVFLLLSLESSLSLVLATPRCRWCWYANAADVAAVVVVVVNVVVV